MNLISCSRKLLRLHFRLSYNHFIAHPFQVTTNAGRSHLHCLSCPWSPILLTPPHYHGGLVVCALGKMLHSYSGETVMADGQICCQVYWCWVFPKLWFTKWGPSGGKTLWGMEGKGLHYWHEVECIVVSGAGSPVVVWCSFVVFLHNIEWCLFHLLLVPCMYMYSLSVPVLTGTWG